MSEITELSDKDKNRLENAFNKYNAATAYVKSKVGFNSNLIPLATWFSYCSTENLLDETEKLNKSTDELNRLTRWLKRLTILLGFLALVQIGLLCKQIWWT